MALLQAGRQLPMLRYLTSLASYQGSVAVATNPRCAGHFSSAGGTGSSPSSDTIEEPGKTAAEKPVASTAGASTSGDAGSPPAAASQPATVDDDDEWTEVVHSSGQLYYWNQRTGETTQLGEPKPKSDRSSGGGGDGDGSASGSAGSAGTQGRAAGGHSHDPRAEAPMEDRTGTYASIGVIIGAFLGWVSQFV